MRSDLNIPINKELLKNDYLNQIRQIAEVLQRTKNYKNLNDVIDINQLFVQCSYIFSNLDTNSLNTVLELVNSCEWSFLLQSRLHFIAKLGFLSFFKVWTVLHHGPNNFKAFIQKMFSLNPIICEKLKYKLSWLRYNIKFKNISYELIWIPPLIVYGLNFWSNSSNSGLRIESLSGGFDGTLGIFFESFRKSSGQLTFELAKTCSNITNQAVFGWLAPKNNLLFFVRDWWLQRR